MNESVKKKRKRNLPLNPRANLKRKCGVSVVMVDFPSEDIATSKSMTVLSSLLKNCQPSSRDLKK